MHSNQTDSAPCLQNRLLAGLPRKDRQRVLADAVLVPLQANTILVSEGQRLRHVYFPVDCTITIFSSSGSAATMAVAVLGAEGMLGSALLLGVGELPGAAVVVGAGFAWRISRKAFAAIISQSDTVKRRLMHYLHHSINNLAQQVVCNRFHSIEARLTRWLLMIHDRVGCDRFSLTQQMLADLLGVRRVGVTLAASALQGRGLIDYQRGVISLKDRKGLLANACDCYGISEAHYQKTLGK